MGKQGKDTGRARTDKSNGPEQALEPVYGASDFVSRAVFPKGATFLLTLKKCSPWSSSNEGPMVQVESEVFRAIQCNFCGRLRMKEAEAFRLKVLPEAVVRASLSQTLMRHQLHRIDGRVPLYMEFLEVITPAPEWAEYAYRMGCVEKDLAQKLDQIRSQLVPILKDLEGRSFGSIEAHQAVVAQIQNLVDGVRQALRCVKCERPSRLRCIPVGKTGLFVFEHMIRSDAGSKRRTSHSAGPDIPSLHLVDMPEDDRRRK